MKNYKLKVDDDEEGEYNVFRTSLVDDPATQKLFAVFSSQEKDKKVLDFKVIEPTPQNKQSVKSENGKFERIISGVWFMPDTDYLRFDFETGEFFTTSVERAELKKMVLNFVKSGASNSFDIHHDGRPVDGLRTVEIWVLEDYKQLSPIFNNDIEKLGYKETDIPLGTVFMSVYVSNEEFFNKKILSGELKGFSIEGLFNIVEKSIRKMSKQKQMFENLGLIQEVGTIVTTDGALSFSKDKITLDGKEVVKGDFKTKTGFSIVVRDGKVMESGFNDEAAAQAEKAAQEAASKAAEEAAKAEAEKKAAEEKAAQEVKTDPTQDEIIAQKVQAALDKIEAKKKAEAEAKEKEDAKLKEIEDLKKQLEEAKKNAPIPKPKSTKVEEYNEETHVKVKRGGKEYAILKK